MAQYYYLTTPIYYVNDKPHIGHAYTTIACDVMARFLRLAGWDVRFLTGTDEHGQKIDKAAKAAGVAPQAFTDEVSQHFRRLVKDPLKADGGKNLLNVSNSGFIRTTEERHKKACQALWRRMVENKAPDGSPNIYKDTYGGWYAVRDEAYYQESELVEKGGKKVAAATGAEVEWVEEESYFFALSKWQGKLLEFYEANPDFVVPRTRYNEVKSFVNGGLKDLSVSRTTFDWGVPVPDAPGHVMYVWVDALTNYITDIGFPDMENANYRTFWADPASAGPVHVVGKDILRFHAVYWPAFLMAANLPCPKRVIAHGWWTSEGEKMSKSLGNVLYPDDMVARAGGIDQLRYFLLRAMPFGNDGDFSQSQLVDTVNADLANNIGNLAQRVLSMIQKNCGGKVPVCDAAALTEKDAKLMEVARVTQQGTSQQAQEDALAGRFDILLKGIIEAAARANEYITEEQPWALGKDPATRPRMEAVLYHLAEVVRCVAIMLQPFAPASAGKMLDQLAVPAGERDFAHLTQEFALEPGTALPVPAPVFPKLEKEK